MSSKEWQDVEIGDPVKSGKLFPSVTVRVNNINGRMFSSWAPWKTLPTISSTKTQEYRFTTILSNNRVGVQHVVFLDDDYSCQLDLSKDQSEIAKRLDEDIVTNSVNHPPKIKIQTDGDLMFFDSQTIHKIMPPHNDGWLYTFELKYTGKQPEPYNAN